MPDSKYFAAIGDVHGEMDAMVEAVRQWEGRFLRNVDFILQVGDFQPLRNTADLETMAVPRRYKRLGDFHKYHSGDRRFPWPVFFIAGNHEPYGFLGHFPGGSKIAENCRYLGQVGWHSRAGLQIAGLSGIYRELEYDRKRPEVEKMHGVRNGRYAYFREPEIEQALAPKAVDVLLLHDWPTHIVRTEDAWRFPRWRNENGQVNIGNDKARNLVNALQPQLVLCGHMHFDYRTTIRHESGVATQVCCLGIVKPEDLPIEEPWVNWMAVFRIGADRSITEVTNCG